MTAFSPGQIDLPPIIWRHKIKSGQTAVIKGEVLAVEIAIGGVSGATEPQLVTPIGGLSNIVGPVVVALEGGKAGDYINVQVQGRCFAKMQGATINPYGACFVATADVANRRFIGTTADADFTIWALTMGVLSVNNNLVEVLLCNGGWGTAGG